MIVAIDYDNTYSADPETFDKLIKVLQDAEHIVICVTGRSDDGIMGEPVKQSIGRLVPIVFAGDEWKAYAAKRRGYDVNVWFDDMPQMIAPQIMLK